MNISDEIREKKLRWALCQRLEQYQNVKYSKETMSRITHEIKKVIERAMSDNQNNPGSQVDNKEGGKK